MKGNSPSSFASTVSLEPVSITARYCKEISLQPEGSVGSHDTVLLIYFHLREHFHELAHDALDIGVDFFQWTGFFRDVEQAGERDFVAVFGLGFVPLRVRGEWQHFGAHVLVEVNTVWHPFGNLPRGVDDRLALTVDGWRRVGVLGGHGVHR